MYVLSRMICNIRMLCKFIVNLRKIIKYIFIRIIVIETFHKCIPRNRTNFTHFTVYQGINGIGLTSRNLIRYRSHHEN